MADTVSALQDAAAKLGSVETNEDTTKQTVQEALDTVNQAITDLQAGTPTTTEDPVWTAVKSALVAGNWVDPSTLPVVEPPVPADTTPPADTTAPA